MARVNRAFRYPVTLRVCGLFGSMLAGSILLGSVLAEIEAADRLDAVLHLFGAIVGVAALWLGLEFGMRRIAVGPRGVTVCLLGARQLAWSEVRGVRDGPLATVLILPRRGLPIVVWPYLEGFGELLDALTNREHARQPTAS